MIKEHRLLSLSLLALVLLSGCLGNSDSELKHNGVIFGITTLPKYGTENDSARFYFIKGWQEILDNGRWTESEAAFRKAVTFDDDWLLGQSLVGRITRNTEERETLLARLEAEKERATPDERLLLDVNLLSMQAANNRDRGIANPPEFNSMRRQLAEKNFGSFIRKWPRDKYFKAEYIEFLHANHGAQTALDSMNALVYDLQWMMAPFFNSYAGMLELELGQIDAAENRLNALNIDSLWRSYPASRVLEAQVLEAKGEIAKAKELMDQVVVQDSNHLIAIGMQARLAKLLEDK